MGSAIIVAPGLLLLLSGPSCSRACGILVLQPGIRLMSPALEHGFLTTRPPGKSPHLVF